MELDSGLGLRGPRNLIAVDTNLLVYAHRRDSKWHQRAVELVRGLCESPSPWGLPWPCLHEFFAIVTHPRIYAPPTTPNRALEQIDAWLESPSVVLLSEGTGYWGALQRLLRSARVAGPVVHDAHVAALCLIHGVRELWTSDRDFGLFSELKTVNPIVA